MLQSFAGVALGLAVGAFCRGFEIPSPAPPHIIGAVILIAMTLGFLAGGWVVAAS